MPIYEYECDGCHSVFEVRQKVSDPAPTQHSCGSSEVRRILSATSFVLKGTGWYATDYGNRKNEGGKTPSEAQKPAGSAEPKSDGKAASQGQESSSDASKKAVDPTPAHKAAKPQSS